MDPNPAASNPASAAQGPLGGLFARYPWLPYVLPLVVFMVGTSLEPKPPGAEAESASTWHSIPYPYYPLVYTLKIALTVGAMAFVWPVYRTIAWRVSPLAVVIGAVGAGLWIGLCQLEIEARYLPAWLVGSGKRSAFNPLAEMADRPALAYGFLAVRLLGLAVIVPVIEEFALRGFLTRYLADDDWVGLPLGRAPLQATLITIAAAGLMHPAELVAALAWFSLVTYLYARTGQLADAITAHAVTNFLLGVYVVASGAWHFL
jgi:CAAX prenyl protease-like protein